MFSSFDDFIILCRQGFRQHILDEAARHFSISDRKTILCRLIEDPAIEEDWIESWMVLQPWSRHERDDLGRPLLTTLLFENRSPRLGEVWLACSRSDGTERDREGLQALDHAVILNQPSWFHWLTQTVHVNPINPGPMKWTSLDYALGARWPQDLKEPRWGRPQVKVTWQQLEWVMKMLKMHESSWYTHMASLPYHQDDHPVIYLGSISLPLRLWISLSRFDLAWFDGFRQLGLSIGWDRFHRGALHWASHAQTEKDALHWAQWAWEDPQVQFCGLNADDQGVLPEQLAESMQYFDLAQWIRAQKEQRILESTLMSPQSLASSLSTKRL